MGLLKQMFSSLKDRRSCKTAAILVSFFIIVVIFVHICSNILTPKVTNSDSFCNPAEYRQKPSKRLTWLCCGRLHIALGPGHVLRHRVDSVSPEDEECKLGLSQYGVTKCCFKISGKHLASQTLASKRRNEERGAHQKTQCKVRVNCSLLALECYHW